MLSNHEKDTKIKRRDAFFLCGLIFKKEDVFSRVTRDLQYFNKEANKHTHTHKLTRS